MTTRQIVVISLVVAVFVLLVLELIRRHRMRERYSMLWFFIALAALSVPLLYGVYARGARLLGFREVNNLFFFLAVVSLFLMSLQFSIALSSAHARSKALAQQLGLLENRVREMEARLGARSETEALPETGAPEA